MGYLAEIKNGKVVRVIACDDIKWAEDNLGGEWLKTSYNTKRGIHCIPNTTIKSEDQTKALRGNFAGVGFEYNKKLDAFIPPKPFDSWLLDEKEFVYIAPKEIPKDGKNYFWDEMIKDWKEFENNCFENGGKT